MIGHKIVNDEGSHPAGGKIGPVDASRVPRYAGYATFGKLPELRDAGSADVAVLGAPFDSGVSYRSGARFGPTHIREASRLLRPFNPATGVHPFALQQVADAGDLSLNPFDISEAVAQIESAARDLSMAGSRLLVLGGDHTIALPLLRVVAERHGPVAVVHFDAHLDTWDTYFGAPITHGTPFRRASEEGLVDRSSSVHIGTRGPLYGSDDLRDDARLGFSIITSDDVQVDGLAQCISRMRTRVGDRPVYISVDIDVLDPAHAPGTGTPEAGGLTSRELLGFIRALAGSYITGADVVEVSPPYDHAQLTAVAASHVAYEIVSAMAQTQKEEQ
jgi:agmatinase